MLTTKIKSHFYEGFKKGVLFLLIYTPVVFVHAVSPKLTVGVNLQPDFQAYKGHDVEYSVLPTLFYDNDFIYAEGDEVGFYLIEDEKNELRLNAYFDGSSYRPSGPLSELDKREWSILAGASYMRITPLGGFKVQVGHDILNRSNGIVATLAYWTEFEAGSWSVYPELGLQWNNARYNQYYFGVSEDEAKRSDIKQYQAKKSMQPYANLIVDYRFNKNWDIFTNLSINYLSNEQYQSPMINSRYEFEPTIGLNYTF